MILVVCKLVAIMDELHFLSIYQGESVSELTEAVEAARQAFAAATNLEELAVARREHLGDDAPNLTGTACVGVVAEE